MKRILAIFSILILGFSVALYLKVKENDEALSAPAGGSGILEGIEVDIVARLPARILEIHVQEGDAVTSGQALVRLDCREQDALLVAATARRDAAQEQARAAQAQARAALGAADAAKAQVGAAGAQKKALQNSEGVVSRQLSRLSQLQGEGGATEMEVDRVKGQTEQLRDQLGALDAQVRAARGQARAASGQAEAARAQTQAALLAVTAADADVARVKTLVQECTLVAPISGYVLVRAFEPGEVTMPGTKVLSLVNIEKMKTSFFIPNAELAAAEVGRKVTITADAYPQREFEGRIVSVSKKAEFTPRNVQTRQDRDRLVYRVEVRAENPDGALRPGMPVQMILADPSQEP